MGNCAKSLCYKCAILSSVGAYYCVLNCACDKRATCWELTKATKVLILPPFSYPFSHHTPATIDKIETMLPSCSVSRRETLLSDEWSYIYTFMVSDFNGCSVLHRGRHQGNGCCCSAIMSETFDDLRCRPTYSATKYWKWPYKKYKTATATTINR